MQSCLEKVSIQGRHEQTARSDYQRNNQYSANHEDARATGTWQGKGTGHGGHSHWLPNCNGQLGVINYSDFDTALASGAGNCDDNKMRSINLARNMYTPNTPYSAQLVDTSKNVFEGQFVMGVFATRTAGCIVK